MNKTGLNGDAFVQNHSADGRSIKGGESWMEDRSNDNISANMRDSHSGNNVGNRAAPSSNTSNLKLKENSAIIPERRRKYLAGTSEER